MKGEGGIILICILFIQTIGSSKEQNLNNLSLFKQAQRSHRSDTREKGLASAKNNSLKISASESFGAGHVSQELTWEYKYWALLIQFMYESLKCSIQIIQSGVLWIDH